MNSLLHVIVNTTWVVICNMIALHFYFRGIPWIQNEKEIKSSLTVKKVKQDTEEDTSEDEPSEDESSEDESSEEKTQEASRDDSNDSDDQQALIEMMRQKSVNALVDRITAKFEALGIGHEKNKEVFSSILEHYQNDLKLLQFLNNAFDDQNLDTYLQFIIQISEQKLKSTTLVETLDQCKDDKII